jgi:hypothetical protein
MPITPFLGGRRFEPEVARVMGLAFVSTCLAMGIENRSDPSDPKARAVATKVIELALLGETDPDRLCERALAELRLR